MSASTASTLSSQICSKAFFETHTAQGFKTFLVQEMWCISTQPFYKNNIASVCVGFILNWFDFDFLSLEHPSQGRGYDEYNGKYDNIDR